MIILIKRAFFNIKGHLMFDPKQPHQLAILPSETVDQSLLKPGTILSLLEANKALAELNGTCRAIPNPYILLNIPILQESVASSEIEGIYTTVETILELQIGGVDENTTETAGKEALRYREAITAGLNSLEKYALSTRTILEIHSKLMPDGTGGYFKQQANQIAKGPSREVVYTPPPPQAVPSLMNNWELYVHSAMNFDSLIRTAVAHYQFEAIHPFSDGNGRTGRILMVLQLVKDQLLDHPVLYISGYLNKNRDTYYRLLANVTSEQKWEDFILFMLEAIREQANVTKEVILNIMNTQSSIKEKIQNNLKNIYSPDLVDHIFTHPVTFPTFMATKLNITYQTASKYLNLLEQEGIMALRKSGRKNMYYNIPLLKCLKT